jgi:glycosyltransferase involved in cell wall biosynthesis
MSVLFPDREIFWAPGAIAHGRRVLAATPHDVVLATHGPASNLVVGSALASAAKLPLVVDFRDLWSTLPMSNAFVSPLHRAAAHRLEGAIVRAASRVVAVAPNMATELASTHGVSGERALSITNGFDPDDLARVHDARADGRRPFRLMYLGTVNANYNLEPFWRAVKRLAEARRITPETLRIEFVGNLAVADVRAYGVDAFIDTKPFVAHSKVFDELARADALLMVETPGYYAHYSYAAKVFDYLVTGKPVLALVEAGGNTARLLGDAGVDHVADPTDAGVIAGVLETLLRLKGARPRVVRSLDPPFAAFDRRNLVRTLAAMLDDVAINEPHGSWS